MTPRYTKDSYAAADEPRLRGVKALPTRDLHPGSFEFARRSVLRIGRVLGVEHKVRESIRDGNSIYAVQSDILTPAMLEMYGLYCDHAYVFANSAIRQVTEDAARLSEATISKALLREFKLQRAIADLNIDYRSSGSPYYPDRDAVKKIVQFGLVGFARRTMKRAVEGGMPHKFAVDKLNQSGVWLARTRREAIRFIRAAFSVPLWAVDSRRGTEWRRAVRMGHEGKTAFSIYMWHAKDVNWADFRQWWQENRAKVLRSCAMGYIRRIAERGDELAQVIVVERENNTPFAAYLLFKMGREKDVPDDDDAQAIITACREWITHHGRLPSFTTVDNVPVDLIEHLNIRHFLRAARTLSAEMGNDDAIEVAARLVGTFSGQWRQWVQRVKRNWGANAHDAAQILPDHHAPGLDAFLFRVTKNKDRNVTMDGLRKIASAWGALSDDDKSSYRKALDAAMALQYKGIVDREVALRAAELGMSQKKFEKYQRFWLNRKRKKASFIPSVTVRRDGYTFTRLDDDDPRGPMLGLYTDCCQHLTGAGKTCAKHGSQDPNGAFFVVLDKKGKIVAQSWAWRSGVTLCFDNIEALGDGDRVKKIYIEGANALLGKLGIRRVTAGVDNSDVDLDDLPRLESPPSPPYGCYTDADDQVLLAEVK